MPEIQILAEQQRVSLHNQQPTVHGLNSKDMCQDNNMILYIHSTDLHTCF